MSEARSTFLDLFECNRAAVMNMSSSVSAADLESFSLHLQSSRRILALLGAGLSASSGLPTFRGVGGLWRSHDAVSLATPEAFEADPGLVWQFYSYRRHMALHAQPNAAHFALAELARRKEGFRTLTQNVDGNGIFMSYYAFIYGRNRRLSETFVGLSQRAGHPADKLHLLHGSLFDVRCTSFYCDFAEQNNFTDPIVPALGIPHEPTQLAPSAYDKTGAEAAKVLYGTMREVNRTGPKELDISDDRIEIPQLQIKDLPSCPKCRNGLLRPGVVWFGEALPEKTIREVDQFIEDSDRIDLILVVGTSAKVYPAAGYVDQAREKGARVAVINMERGDTPSGGLSKGDWFFEGDAGVIIPEILQSVIGKSNLD